MRALNSESLRSTFWSISASSNGCERHSCSLDARHLPVQSTDLGRIASHYYVSYHTLATYNEHLRVTMGDIELLRLFALSDEFRFMVVRDLSLSAIPVSFMLMHGRHPGEGMVLGAVSTAHKKEEASRAIGGF